MIPYHIFSLFFFFNDTATTEIYTLSLHDALPIWSPRSPPATTWSSSTCSWNRSEEHTSELQSRVDLVCRLLLEKKKLKSSDDTEKTLKRHTRQGRQTAYYR